MRLIELLRDASKSDQENEMALSYRVNLQSVKMVYKSIVLSSSSPFIICRCALSVHCCDIWTPFDMVSNLKITVSRRLYDRSKYSLCLHYLIASLLFGINFSERMVEMDRDTYEALQIFRCGNGSSWLTRGIDYQRNHRHMLSIFNICNRCLSYPGKKLIRLDRLHYYCISI
jgi:hypothetical protein